MYSLFKRTYWYLFHHVFMASTAQCVIIGRNIKQSHVSVCSHSRLIVDPCAQISDSTIQLHEGASLFIGKNVILHGVSIELHASQLDIISDSFIEESKVIAFINSTIRIDAGLRGTQIEMSVHDSEVIINKQVSLSSWKLEIDNGSQLLVGENVVCERGDYWRDPVWMISHNSKVQIGNYNRLRNSIWLRFGAQLKIGTYNCINEGTEIRSDESVIVGDYNMISYLCRIWDTDTHKFYDDNTRRVMTQEMFPRIGVEVDKPSTKPIYIGNDCLIGEGAVIMKGSIIGDKVKIGARALVSNVCIEENHTAVCAKCRVL